MPIVAWQCAQGDAPSVTLPCAATVALAPPDNSVDTNKIIISGSGTITSFGPPPGPQINDPTAPPVAVGITKQVTFEPTSTSSPIVLTNSPPTLVLIGNASRTIVAKSIGTYCCDAVGNWTEESFGPAAGIPASFTAMTMLFLQPAAPTGWTRVTTYDDALLRIVGSATPGAGGATAFSIFNAQTVTGNTTLTTSTIPSHIHPQDPNTMGDLGSGTGLNAGSNYFYTKGGSNTGAQGGGAAHAHGITTAIKYVDALIAKNS
jgi:hypothetical protein